MYSSMMQTLVSARNSAGLPTFSPSSRPASTPETTMGSTGVPVLVATLDRTGDSGSTLSRDIEKIIRLVAVWIASVQTQIATATSSSSSLPGSVPSRLVSTYGRPWLARLPSVRLGAAINAATIRKAPPTPETTTARMIVRGAVARGLWVSSDSSPAESKPTST